MVLQRDELTSWQRARELQKKLYDGGFAGICFPREYGGLGLGYEYKKAFDAEALAYETPLMLNVPSFAICCATILDMGSEEQKRTHIAAALRGDEVLAAAVRTQWGSDLAGILTAPTAVTGGGSSTAPRRGARGRSPPTTACAWPGLTGTRPNTKG
ncbi:hypothetical protein MPRS_21030 [Mycobacterium paraseoulense]|nr:hypothetical protein MPRS_21030 [Mycobacterium paraseoulense]